MQRTASLTKRIAAMVVAAIAMTVCGVASASLPTAVEQGVLAQHPGGRVASSSVDADGLYVVAVEADGQRYQVELTKSGRVVNSKSLGPVSSAHNSANLPAAVMDAVKNLYPSDQVTSATTDADGIYRVEVSHAGGTTQLEVTRSGRVLRHDRDATDSDEDFSAHGTSPARHIESVRKLPAQVLASVEQARPQGVIVHVYQDMFGPKFGRPAYFVRVVDANVVYDIGLSAQGQVMKNEIGDRTDRIQQLPTAIRSAVLRTYPNGLIYGAGQRNRIHQIDVLVDGLPYDLEITATGEVVSNKRDFHE